MRPAGAWLFAFSLACLLLAGCWAGPLFYSAREIRAPIPAPDYRGEAIGFPEEKVEQEVVRVSVLPNGLTRFDTVGSADDTSIYGFVPLEGRPGWFVAWLVEPKQAKQRDADVAYYLMQQAKGEFRLFLPVCSDAAKQIALDAGAVVKPDAKAAVCRFSSRASLESAFRHLAELDLSGVRLVPVED